MFFVLQIQSQDTEPEAQDPVPERFTCNMCGQSYSAKRALSKHAKKKHARLVWLHRDIKQ